MKFLRTLLLSSSAALALSVLSPVVPIHSALRHKRQTTLGGGSSTLTPGGSSSGSSSSLTTPNGNAGSISGQLPYFNITDFVATSNSRTATYSFNLAYWPGQPQAACYAEEASWSGYFSYTEANCTNDPSYGASTEPLNAFRIDPQADGSLDIYIASIYFDYAKLCNGCVEAANGTLASNYVTSNSAFGNSNSVSGQRYTGPANFALVTYLE